MFNLVLNLPNPIWVVLRATHVTLLYREFKDDNAEKDVDGVTRKLTRRMMERLIRSRLFKWCRVPDVRLSEARKRTRL